MNQRYVWLMFLFLFFMGIGMVHFFTDPHWLGSKNMIPDSLSNKDSLHLKRQADTNLTLPSPPLIKTTAPEPEEWNAKSALCVNDYELKQLVKACDYAHETVRSYAVQLAGITPGELNLGQVCNIFDHLYGNWSYVNDPNDGDNYVEKASNTILYNFKGDCDDYAVTMASMLLAIGAHARITYADGFYSGHAFTEINLGQADLEFINKYLQARYPGYEKVQGRTDADGNFWMNLDWNCAYPGGKYFTYYKGHVFHIAPAFCYHFVRNI